MMIDLRNINILSNEGLRKMVEAILPFLNDHKNPHVGICVDSYAPTGTLLKDGFYRLDYSIAIHRIAEKRKSTYSYHISLCDVFDRDDVTECNRCCAKLTKIRSLITNNYYCTHCGR